MAAALALLGCLFSVAPVLALAPPLHRDYDGTRSVTPRLAKAPTESTTPPDDTGFELPEGEDLGPEDLDDPPLLMPLWHWRHPSCEA